MKKEFNQDIFIGILFLFLSSFFLKESFNLESPGAEYFPQVLSFLLIIFNIFLIIKGIFSKNKKSNYFTMKNRENLIILLKVSITSLTYLVLWVYVPFIILTTAYIFILGFIFKLDKKRTILSSLILSLIIYGVFSKIFHVMLS